MWVFVLFHVTWALVILFHFVYIWIHGLTSLLYIDCSSSFFGLGLAFRECRQLASFSSPPPYSWAWCSGGPMCSNSSFCCHCTFVCGNQRGEAYSCCLFAIFECDPFVLSNCVILTYWWLNLVWQSTLVQSVVTVANICAMIFVIIAGGYLGFKTDWPGYELPVG